MGDGRRGEGIRGYRSGYLPRQRREIEKGLRDGSVKMVVATNALELGIDIGGLGAALLVGYPGTIASAIQQAGRAGRGDEPALAVLVATASPLDQFLAHHPEYFFARSPEQALINPDHLLILLNHLRCAMFELPFQEGRSLRRAAGGRVSGFPGVQPGIAPIGRPVFLDGGRLPCGRSLTAFGLTGQHRPARRPGRRIHVPSARSTSSLRLVDGAPACGVSA